MIRPGAAATHTATALIAAAAATIAITRLAPEPKPQFSHAPGSNRIIQGRVIDGAGKPVPAAVVRFTAPGSTQALVAVPAAENGGFALLQPVPVPVTAQAIAPGVQFDPQSVEKPGDCTLLFKAREALPGSIAGRGPRR